MFILEGRALLVDLVVWGVNAPTLQPGQTGSHPQLTHLLTLVGTSVLSSIKWRENLTQLHWGDELPSLDKFKD